jgi:hypothetical protein
MWQKLVFATEIPASMQSLIVGSSYRQRVTATFQRRAIRSCVGPGIAALPCWTKAQFLVPYVMVAQIPCTSTLRRATADELRADERLERAAERLADFSSALQGAEAEAEGVQALAPAMSDEQLVELLTRVPGLIDELPSEVLHRIACFSFLIYYSRQGIMAVISKC